jgi:DNA-binding MarR family transcriptional regulator
MATDRWPTPDVCNCLVLRYAARHVSQFYDQFLAEAGLRTSQFSILAKLRRSGPLSINALAKQMVMDRTTLGRAMLPLERDGLIAIVRGRADRRSKELQLTEAGVARLREAAKGWAKAQAQFETVFGGQRASELRALLHAVSASDLAADDPTAD